MKHSLSLACLTLLLPVVVSWTPIEEPSTDRPTGSETTLVVLVRHAEKETTGRDPDLSDAGKSRARELARTLGNAHIDAIYTSDYLRTRATAVPIAEAFNLIPETVDAGDFDGIAKRILDEHRGESVLVVGHSNTVPEIVKALGGEAPAMTEAEYDNLYIVAIPTQGDVRTLRLAFGTSAQAR